MNYTRHHVQVSTLLLNLCAYIFLTVYVLRKYLIFTLMYIRYWFRLKECCLL